MVNSERKIQRLLVKHLLETGNITLRLPGQMTVEIGIVQENENGNMVQVEDYSWLIASQDEREVFMDNLHQGLKYRDKEIVYDEVDSKTFSVI